LDSVPLYEYQATEARDCPTCSRRFEVYQRMSDPPLLNCPECGKPVERIFSAPSIHGPDILANKSLAEKGFTKYVKAGDGVYEKKTGAGPDVIRR
jgi:putative FmdB family regulatory protein